MIDTGLTFEIEVIEFFFQNWVLLSPNNFDEIQTGIERHFLTFKSLSAQTYFDVGKIGEVITLMFSKGHFVIGDVNFTTERYQRGYQSVSNLHSGNI